MGVTARIRVAMGEVRVGASRQTQRRRALAARTVAAPAAAPAAAPCVAAPSTAAATGRPARAESPGHELHHYLFTPDNGLRWGVRPLITFLPPTPSTPPGGPALPIFQFPCVT